MFSFDNIYAYIAFNITKSWKSLNVFFSFNQSQKVVKIARAMLEYVEERLQVPMELVGK